MGAIYNRMNENSKDTEDVWDERLKCEFETHDVEAAINTMIRAIRTSYHDLN
jgi:hypothetical protein